MRGKIFIYNKKAIKKFFFKKIKHFSAQAAQVAQVATAVGHAIEHIIAFKKISGRSLPKLLICNGQSIPIKIIFLEVNFTAFAI